MKKPRKPSSSVVKKRAKRRAKKVVKLNPADFEGPYQLNLEKFKEYGIDIHQLKPDVRVTDLTNLSDDDIETIIHDDVLYEQTMSALNAINTESPSPESPSREGEN